MSTDRHYPHGLIIRACSGPDEIAEYEDDTGHLVLRGPEELDEDEQDEDDDDEGDDEGGDDEDDEDGWDEDDGPENFYAYCSTASLAEDLVEMLLERELGREPKDRHERAMRAERLLRRLHRITTGQDSADEQQLETAVGTLLMDLALWCHARDLCFDGLAETAEANACELATAEHTAALKTLAAEIAAKTPLRAVCVTIGYDEDEDAYELEVEVDRDQVVATYPTDSDDLDVVNDLCDALEGELDALGFAVYSGEADWGAYLDAKDKGEAPPPPRPFAVFVVAGSDNTVAEIGQDAIAEYHFATEAERKAFLQGLDAHDGWLECEVFDTREEAEAHVAEAQGDPADADEA